MTTNGTPALCCVLLCATVPCCEALGADGKDFFSLTVSMTGGNRFLSGQDLYMRIRTSNLHGTELSYMPEMGNIAHGTTVEVRSADGLVKPSGLTIDYFQDYRARTLRKGESTEGVFPLSLLYGRLPVGTYRALARLKQEATALGLDPGEAVSDEIGFTIVPWEARWVKKRELPGVVAGLIWTTEGDLVAAWDYLKIGGDWDSVVPFGKDLPFDELLWTADRHACIVAVPGSSGQKAEMIVIHNHTSVVESFALRGGMTEGGLAVPPGSHVRAPSEPEGGDRTSEVKSSATGTVVCTLSGLVFGLLLGAAAAWLLMRRKRRAS